MLRAYLDRSEIHKPARLVTVAGGVASLKRWTKFEQEWRATLESEGLESFHMTDFETRHPPYDGPAWTRARRVRLLRRLIGVLHTTIWSAVGASLMLDEYDALSALDKSTLGPPYQVCGFKAVILAIQAVDAIADKADAVEKQRRSARRVIREPIAFVFEAGDHGAGELSGILHAFKRQNDYFGSRIHSWHFESKQHVKALEAADLLAYESIKQVARSMGADTRAVRKTMARMTQRFRFEGQFFDRGRLAKLAADLRGEREQPI